MLISMTSLTEMPPTGGRSVQATRIIGPPVW